MLSQTDGSVPLIVILTSVLPSFVTLMGEGVEKPPGLGPVVLIGVGAPDERPDSVPEPNSMIVGVIEIAVVAATVALTVAGCVVANPVNREKSPPI